MSFQPVTVLDLGAATGKFTAAVMQRLGEWQCLQALRSLQLVEEEPDFGGPERSIAEASITARCRSALAPFADPSAEIELSNELAVVIDGGEINDPRIKIGHNIIENADLILASHLTYYFHDGGRAFIQALANGLRRSSGLGWIVVRSKECPIYRELEKHLRDIGYNNVGAETGYAEDLEKWIASPESGLKLIDARYQSYLKGTIRRQSDMNAASLLMWRKPLQALSGVEKARLKMVLRSKDPLFVERHFIVKSFDKAD